MFEGVYHISLLSDSEMVSISNKQKIAELYLNMWYKYFGQVSAAVI